MKYYIYTLSCPISGEVKYIGRTSDLNKRLNQHIYDKRKSYKTNWIRSLDGLKPIIEILDEADTIKEAHSFEMYWIAQFKAWGYKLTNLRNGGEGYSSSDIQGEKAPWAKITELQAKSIIADLLTGKYSLKDITVRNQTTRDIVLNIRNKTCWAHLTYGIDFKSVKRHRLIRHGKRPVKVVQLSLDGEKIDCFDSVSDASLKTKINRSNISLCITGKYKSAGGYKWIKQ